MKTLRRLALAALCAATTLCALPATPALAVPYGIESAEVSLSSNQAGAHADFTTSFALTKEGNLPAAFTRDLTFKLPPGLAGNPQAIPLCTTLQFATNPIDSECPISSQVGIAKVETGSGTATEPIYNLTRPAGTDVVARFGFYAFAYPIVLNVRVDPIDFGLVVSAEGAPAGAKLISSTTTIWGVPAAKAHDQLRLTPKEANEGKSPLEGRPAGVPEAPFLTNPTSCGDPGELEITATSYQDPANPASIEAPMPQIVGCDSVKFFPSFTIAPTNPEAAAPSGIEAELKMATDETPNGRGTSPLRYATVSLPEGFAINPAAGDGLAACSAAQVHFEEAAAPQCPDAAKLGSAEIEVPALEHALHASIYQRTPEPGRLFGFWLTSDELGVRLKLPAAIEADPATGRLTTTFAGTPAIGGNPQFPVEDLKLRFGGGPRAPIATPNACGTYRAPYEFTPWSGNAPVRGTAPMQISTGCAKGGFAPSLLAGTLDPTAGSFASFLFALTRSDGEANPATLSATLPQGLIAKLAGIPLCPAADAPAGNCPEASRIGSVATAAGVGGAPLWIPQPGKAPTAVYLSGPYRSAPYSLVVKVPAQAGPFDLGTVITRAAIAVDPETAIVHATSDPLPQIIAGVPIAYRAIRLSLDRPRFVLNPTDCDPMQIVAHLTATDGQSADPASGYQAANCARLRFAPRMTLRLKGGTRRAAHPKLIAAVHSKGIGVAGLARIQVLLPRSAFLDQAHIRTICTRVQWAAGAGGGSQCPGGSIYGTARVKTPLFDFPLTGNVYLRSSSHKLPDLVIALQGPGPDPLRIELSGKTDSVHGSLRNTFEAVPDAPFEEARVVLFGGKRGLVVNSRNLCAQSKRARRANIRALGQNGLLDQLHPLVRDSCHTAKGKSHRRHRKGGGA